MKARRRYCNLTGDANFPVANACGRYRSQLARRGCIHLLLDPLVNSFRLGEPRVGYETGSAKHWYTGHVLVHLVSGLKRRPLVIEYRPQASSEGHSDNRPPSAMLLRALDASGYDYKILHECDVTRDLAMKEFVCGYLNNPASPGEENLLNIVRAHGKISLGRLLAAGTADEIEQLELVPLVWRLVALKRAFIDFSHMATMDTEICSVPVCPSLFL